MAGNWDGLKSNVASAIKSNNKGEITGDVLQSALFNIISNLGKATFAGIATPATIPGIPDGPVFYLAYELGSYSGFNGVLLDGTEVVIFTNVGSMWYHKSIGAVCKNGLKTINNQSLFGQGNINVPSVYVADFSVAQLSSVADGDGAIRINGTALATEIESGSIVLVPEGTGSGYRIVSGAYREGLLYFSVSPGPDGVMYSVDIALSNLNIIDSVKRVDIFGIDYRLSRLESRL